jgi:hypothetical protein
MTQGTKAAIKTAESVLAFCVVGLACFIGGQSFAMRKLTARHESAGAIVERVHSAPAASDTSAAAANGVGADESFGTAAPEMRVSDAARPTLPSLSAVELRRRLRDGAHGTYIDDLIASRDSAVVRWPDRLTRPLRVWVSEDERLAGWNADFVPAVRDAFDTWVETGIPVHFTYIRDSASADVHVHFTERFVNGISGKTIWSRDAAWWLVSSDIQLGLAHPSGGTVSPPQMRAIALHEVGHLLGLDHARDLDNIMSARIRVRDLTETDRATVRLLYSVPAGSLR